MSSKLIISLIVLLVSGALVFFISWPFFGKVMDLKDEISSKQAQVQKIHELISKTNQLERDYEQVADQAEKVFAALPKGEDIPYLLIQFEDLAVRNGLLLGSIDFSRDNAGKSSGSGLGAEGLSFQDGASSIQKVSAFPSLGVSVSLTGSYESFRNYIDDIEKSVRSIDVSEVAFGGGASSESGSQEDTAQSLPTSGIFEFDLSTSVYYQ